MIERGFGRLPAADARDAAYPMRAALRPGPLPTSRYFNTGRLLPFDQGSTGTCVGMAWTGFLLAAPLMCKDAPSPYDTYRGLILLDEWADNDVEATQPDARLQFGSSVRAGAKYLQGQGRLASYVWTNNTEDMAKWILTGRGVIVLGTDWHWNMSEPDDEDVVHLGGGLAGGHAYLCVGYNRTTRMFRCLNSWGTAFGQRGRFWISQEDMAFLLAAGGESCAAVEQPVAPL